MLQAAQQKMAGRAENRGEETHPVFGVILRTDDSINAQIQWLIWFMD